MTQTTLINRMAEVLQECADDLQAEIDAKYNGDQDKYPSQMLLYQRDILPITKARELLAEKFNAGL